MSGINTEPPLKVIALEYGDRQKVPVVSMKAAGTQAEQVLRLNRSGAGIRVVKDKALAEQLFRLPLEGEIGRELYGVVARLLIHVFEVEEKMMRGQGG